MRHYWNQWMILGTFLLSLAWGAQAHRFSQSHSPKNTLTA
jgi:hypothetical protein